MASVKARAWRICTIWKESRIVSSVASSSGWTGAGFLNSYWKKNCCMDLLTSGWHLFTKLYLVGGGKLTALPGTLNFEYCLILNFYNAWYIWIPALVPRTACYALIITIYFFTVTPIRKVFQGTIFPTIQLTIELTDSGLVRVVYS